MVAYNGDIWFITLLQKFLFLHISFLAMFHVSIGWLEIYPSWLISCLLNQRSIWNLSKQKHLALSSSHPKPSTKQQPTKWKQMLINENSKVPKSQAFELFEFLIYSIPVFHTIFDKEKDLSRVHSSCCLGDRFAFELSVRCMSVFRSAIQI